MQDILRRTRNKEIKSTYLFKEFKNRLYSILSSIRHDNIMTAHSLQKSKNELYDTLFPTKN